MLSMTGLLSDCHVSDSAQGIEFPSDLLILFLVEPCVQHSASKGRLVLIGTDGPELPFPRTGPFWGVIEEAMGPGTTLSENHP